MWQIPSTGSTLASTEIDWENPTRSQRPVQDLNRAYPEYSWDGDQATPPPNFEAVTENSSLAILTDSFKVKCDLWWRGLRGTETAASRMLPLGY
jgi:hypothetical protein